MENKKDAFYFFISLTRGNWRNAMFIECKNKCNDKCKGFLMTADTEGVPMFYPVALFEEKSKQIIDTNECAVMDYFEIFLNRMILCRKAAAKLGAEFRLVINNQPIM